jgi:hypothetical protein
MLVFKELSPLLFLPLVVPMVDSIQAPSDLVYCGDTIILSTSKALLELLIERTSIGAKWRTEVLGG